MLTVQQREDRDSQIVQDYKDGLIVVEIVAKHRVTSAYIYKILKKEGVSLNRRKK